jgi:hypothetical protein
MKDSVTLGYINMYGILGALQDLCSLSADAKALLPPKPLTVCFAISNGPAVRLQFAPDGCTVTEGAGRCDIKLPVSDYEKFNAIIDGTANPFPSKGFTKIGFLLKNFTALTKLLESYLRADDKALADPAFFNASTTIMFYLIAQAVTQIGNRDDIGSFSASNIADGTVVLSIAGGPQAAITSKAHKLTCSREIPKQYNAIMEFKDMQLARALFDGKVSALACVGKGLISMRGNLGMVDNINRILDRVAVYLA